MLDRYAIVMIRWPLKQAAVQLTRWGAKPDTVTMSGFFYWLTGRARPRVSSVLAGACVYCH